MPGRRRVPCSGVRRGFRAVPEAECGARGQGAEAGRGHRPEVREKRPLERVLYLNGCLEINSKREKGIRKQKIDFTFFQTRENVPECREYSSFNCRFFAPFRVDLSNQGHIVFVLFFMETNKFMSLSKEMQTPSLCILHISYSHQ